MAWPQTRANPKSNFRFARPYKLFKNNKLVVC
jgi:hypothetical protein